VPVVEPPASLRTATASPPAGSWSPPGSATRTRWLQASSRPPAPTSPGQRC